MAYITSGFFFFFEKIERSKYKLVNNNNNLKNKNQATIARF